jgi:hypothetical protein
MPSETKLSLYRLLLDKYAELINTHEQRTVEQIKSVVNPDDLTVQSLALQFKPQKYEYERDYLFTLHQIYEFITREIQYVPNDLNINFWLSPKEILTHKVSDDEDLAVLLCSTMHALGDTRAQVYIMEMENIFTHAMVITEINEKTLLLDPCLQHGFFKYYGEKPKIFQKYRFNGQKIKRAVTRFSPNSYEQFI